MTKGSIKEILRDRSFIIRLGEEGAGGWWDLRGGGGGMKKRGESKGKILDLKGDHQNIPSNFVVTAFAIM